MAAFGIAGFVDDEDAAGMRAEHGVRLPLLQAAAVERGGVPGRIVQEVVQRLPPYAGHNRRQLHQRLVVLTGQQQADEVLPQRGALFVAPQQVVELRTELVDRLRRRDGGLTWSRHGNTAAAHVARQTACHRR